LCMALVRATVGLTPSNGSTELLMCMSAEVTFLIGT
jgi:hypothetical protein